MGEDERISSKGRGLFPLGRDCGQGRRISSKGQGFHLEGGCGFRLGAKDIRDNNVTRLKIIQYNIIFCLNLIGIAAMMVGGHERAISEARVETRGYLVSRRRGGPPMAP